MISLIRSFKSDQEIHTEEEKMVNSKDEEAKISPFPHQHLPATAVRFLPLDVVYDILCNLPATSVARFRCVCKQWRSLAIKGKILLFCPVFNSSTFKLYEVDNDNNLKDRSFNFRFGDMPSYRLSNSVNGLICAYSKVSEPCGDRFHYLLNPLLREVAKLPMSIKGRGFSPVGLGFDAITGVYKLVKLFSTEDNSEVCGYEVLSVGAQQEWQYVGEAPCRLPMLHPAFVNGTLFWAVLSCYSTVSRFPKPYVIAFDLKDDHKFRLIPSPDPVLDLFHVALVESQGHLCFVQHPIPTPSPRFRGAPRTVGPNLVIWSLQDHASHVWTKQYHIDLSSVASPTFWPCIIGIRGHEVLLEVFKGDSTLPKMICSYDLHTKTLHELCSNAWAYGLRFITESLVSPTSLIPSISQ